MSKLRQSARDKPCLIRIPGGCLGGGDTVVLCHYPLAGYSGKGLKSPDEMAAYGCFYCHNIVDGRSKAPDGWIKSDVRLAHAEGVMRTIIYGKEGN